MIRGLNAARLLPGTVPSLALVTRRTIPGDKVKPNKLSYLFVVALLSLLTFSTWLAAQEKRTKHHHYKLVDLGTFGGPTSAIGNLVVSLNNRGRVTSCADTSTPDPNYPNINGIWFQNPFIQHAFLGDDEGSKDLGTLPGGTSS